MLSRGPVATTGYRRSSTRRARRAAHNIATHTLAFAPLTRRDRVYPCGRVASRLASSQRTESCRLVFCSSTEVRPRRPSHCTAQSSDLGCQQQRANASSRTANCVRIQQLRPSTSSTTAKTPYDSARAPSPSLSSVGAIWFHLVLVLNPCSSLSLQWLYVYLSAQHMRLLHERPVMFLSPVVVTSCRGY